MNDDRMDDLIAHGTRDYNEPGSVPREDMWARIEAERQGRPSAAVSRAGSRRWIIGVAGIAAAALLAVGIVIGRRIDRTRTPAGSSIARKSVAPSRDSVVAALRNETTKTSQDARQLAENSAARPTDSDNLAYRLVVLRHLAGSEAMITAFRSSARSGEVDAQIADWSRELLGTTRMLESSPVAQDPTMKRLLQDLDLVIVQIARYTSTGKSNPDDLDLIEQSINKRGVLTKLRSTARAFPAGT